jgi:serine/threonine protein kinase
MMEETRKSKLLSKMVIQRQWFIDSRMGNIKDQYHFVERVGSGAFGVVYLAEHRKSGKNIIILCKGIYLGERYAVKAI